MAYTNGVFCIDLVNGSDAARTTLAGCIASNPSGTITRITKTAHGLETGAIVDLTQFSTWLNSAWKVTKIDNDNFDLDEAVWQTTTDTNGTVAPRGGSSWADAWKTISTGASAARIQAGDEIRISKTPDPVSIGNATWTDKSRIVTLATASCLTIDNCETAWTATGSTNSAAVTNLPFPREGTYCIRISRTSYQTGTLLAYRNFTSSINLSQYNGLTFWCQTGNSAILANRFRLVLCTGSNGSGIVDEFLIPANATPNRWNCLSLTRSSGGVLNSNVNSIAVYTHTVAPDGSTSISFDNISAFKTGSLSLTTLISKNSIPIDGDEQWTAIQSINNNTILLDNAVSAYSTEGRGYYGNTETVETYIREAFVTTPVSTTTSIANTVQDTGVSGSLIYYKGGWNTGSNSQDGETYCMAGNSIGYFLSYTDKNFLSIERLCPSRYSVGFYNNSSDYVTINCSNINNNEVAIDESVSTIFCSITSKNICNNARAFDINMRSGYFSCSSINNNAGNSVLDPVVVDIDKNSRFYVNRICNNSRTGIVLGGVGSVYNINTISENSSSYGLETITGTDLTVKNTTLSGNFAAAVDGPISHRLNLINCTLLGVEFPTFFDYYGGSVTSQNHDLSGQNWTFTNGGTINSQSSSFSGSTGNEWRLLISKNTRTSDYPLTLEIGKFAVNSGSLVTVISKMKKSHATDINGKLVVFTDPPDRDYKIISTLDNNTNEQTISGSFVPASNGVISVEIWAEYVNSVGSVIVDNINVTQ